MAKSWTELFNNLVDEFSGGGKAAPPAQQEPQSSPKISNGSLMDSIWEAVNAAPDAFHQGSNSLMERIGQVPRAFDLASSPYLENGAPLANLGNIIARGAGFNLVPSRRDMMITQEFEKQMADQNNRVAEVKKSLSGKVQKVEQKTPEAFAKALGDAIASASTGDKMQIAMKGNEVVPFENKKKGFSRSSSDSQDMWSKGILGEQQVRLAKGIGADVFEAVGIPKEAAKQIAELTKGQQPSIATLLQLFSKENGSNDLQSLDAVMNTVGKNDGPQSEDFWPIFLGRFHNSQNPNVQEVVDQVMAARQAKQKAKK